MTTNERPFPCGKPRNGPTAYRDSVGRIRCRCCKRRSDRNSWRRKRAEHLAQRNRETHSELIRKDDRKATPVNEFRPQGLLSFSQMMTQAAKQGCMNGHDPEHMTVRPNGARICQKCNAEYSYKNRNRRPAKETHHDDRNL